ncbi:hypothetical protein FGB62_2g414 [Gracilaria domingensis]|nr:hypothetical protein FGB62_2g414 [Gracilaria domingensis]
MRKTEYTLTFIAGAAAGLQSIVEEDHSPGFQDFLEDYVPQVLDRIFALLESLEAPPKKSRNGNLFRALPGMIAESAAHLISVKLTESACTNDMKYYGALVRAAAAAAVVPRGGSSVSIFVPYLIRSILDHDDSAVETSKKCLATHAVPQIGEHLDEIALIIRPAMDKSSCPTYKAEGRLLGSVIEGLTSVEMQFGPGTHILTEKEWIRGENLVELFMNRAAELCNYSPKDKELKSFTTDRDVLFRVLRLLHALQNGGRWFLAGAMPDHFKALDKKVAGSITIAGADAHLALKKPIQVGFGGERVEGNGYELGTSMWKRLYSLISLIMKKVMQSRPDDGALLYCSLEPI